MHRSSEAAADQCMHTDRYVIGGPKSSEGDISSNALQLKVYEHVSRREEVYLEPIDPFLRNKS